MLFTGPPDQGQSLNRASRLIDTHSEHSQRMRNVDDGLVSKRWEFSSFSLSARFTFTFVLFFWGFCLLTLSGSLMKGEEMQNNGEEEKKTAFMEFKHRCGT